MAVQRINKMYRYEQNPINETVELVIDGWENGIAASPELGVNIKNCNIESVRGTVRPNYKVIQTSTPAFSYTFTADSVTNLITLPSPAIAFNYNFVAVNFSNSGGALPGGLSANTRYYLILIGGAGSTTYKVATTLANAFAGTSVTITSNGTGTNTVKNTDTQSNGSFSNTGVGMKTITYMVNAPIISSGAVSYAQFALDNSGKVWYNQGVSSLPGSQWVLLQGNTIDSSTSGNGLSYFVSSGSSGNLTTYLFVYRNNQVDVLKVNTFPAAYVETWSNSWLTSTLDSGAGTGLPRFSLLGQDNIIYTCNGRYIASIAEVAGKNFDPTDNTTYTQNNRALTLPSNTISQCLEQLGVNLLVGDMNTNYIYPWDRTSTSFTLPLRCAEDNIWRMKNVDNTVYILAGTKGHVYQTTGYAITREMKIPEYISGGSITAWGGMDKVSGALLFGASPTTSANAGVYKLYTNVGTFAGSIVGSLICDETPSIGATNPTAIVGDYLATDEFYYFGYNGGIDQVDTAKNRLNNYESFVESDLIPVGTATEPKAYQNIEYKLDFAPSSGNIRLSWRTDLNASYTVIKDISVANKISDIFPASMSGIQYLQIKAELKGGSGFDTPRLREIRLR